MAGKKRGSIRNERGPPDREIDKLQAIRHLLHASIRMLFADEDPFALHLVCHSCDKLITDCIKADNLNAGSFIDHVVRPEYRKEFYVIYREVYNYLKHANTDRNSNLGVRQIVQINELSILFNIKNINEIMTFNTAHTRYYFGYAMVMFKPLFDANGLKEIFKYAGADFHVGDSFTREEILSIMRNTAMRDATYLVEKREDLVDIYSVANVLVKDYEKRPAKD